MVMGWSRRECAVAQRVGKRKGEDESWADADRRKAKGEMGHGPHAREGKRDPCRGGLMG
jgi:hypothetical protein